MEIYSSTDNRGRVWFGAFAGVIGYKIYSAKKKDKN